jgi:hypothetical protein
MCLSFYCMFAVVIFSIDIIYQEIFWNTQIFTSYDECSFSSRRGRIALVGHLLTWILFSLPGIL